jgi:hypothetical protein
MIKIEQNNVQEHGLFLEQNNSITFTSNSWLRKFGRKIYVYFEYQVKPVMTVYAQSGIIELSQLVHVG